MPKSFNHAVYRMPEDDIAYHQRQGYPCADRAGVPKGQRCSGKPEYVTQYEYVTGRRGRVSDARKAVCERHARKFAEKHGLEWPPTQMMSRYGQVVALDVPEIAAARGDSKRARDRS